MQDKPRDLITPGRRVYLSRFLHGIPRETIEIGSGNYTFPSPEAVSQEEDTIVAGLQSPEEKQACHNAYTQLRTFLDEGRSYLAEVSRTTAGRTLNDADRALLARAGAAFSRAEKAAKAIDAKYQRIIDTVDKTVDGIGQKPPRTFDEEF